ncbi:hypothetical protein LguiB_006611 [Lonicera macranthoides]
MKKVELKLDKTDEKVRPKAMRVTSCLLGIDSITLDMKEKKMTMIRDVEYPVTLVGKLRKVCHTEILTVCPAKKHVKKKKKPDADIKKKIIKEERMKYISYDSYLSIPYKFADVHENSNKQTAIKDITTATNRMLQKLNILVVFFERHIETTVVGKLPDSPIW